MLLVHGLECEKVFFYVYAVEVNNEREREGVVDEQLLKGEFHNIFVKQHKNLICYDACITNAVAFEFVRKRESVMVHKF